MSSEKLKETIDRIKNDLDNGENIIINIEDKETKDHEDVPAGH